VCCRPPREAPHPAGALQAEVQLGLRRVVRADGAAETAPAAPASALRQSVQRRGLLRQHLDRRSVLPAEALRRPARLLHGHAGGAPRVQRQQLLQPHPDQGKCVRAVLPPIRSRSPQDEARVNRRFEEAQRSGVAIERASVPLQRILDHLVDGPAIVLTNARLLSCDVCKLNKISTELRKCIPWPTPYQGHYVVLCGYELAARKVYYRNPSFADRKCPPLGATDLSQRLLQGCASCPWTRSRRRGRATAPTRTSSWSTRDSRDLLS
jgi:hypothetical protein